MFIAVVSCLLILVGGCAGDPGSLTQGEVEAKLKDALNLTAVSLSARPEGGYAGTGTAVGGTSYKITVEQKKGDRSLWYSARSDAGELKAGGFQEFGPAWLRWLSKASVGVKVVLILLVVLGSGFVIVRRLLRTGMPTEP